MFNKKKTQVMMGGLSVPHQQRLCGLIQLTSWRIVWLAAWIQLEITLSNYCAAVRSAYALTHVVFNYIFEDKLLIILCHCQKNYLTVSWHWAKTSRFSTENPHLVSVRMAHRPPNSEIKQLCYLPGKIYQVVLSACTANGTALKTAEFTSRAEHYVRYV